jgi:hypothetical protein
MHAEAYAWLACHLAPYEDLSVRVLEYGARNRTSRPLLTVHHDGEVFPASSFGVVVGVDRPTERRNIESGPGGASTPPARGHHLARGSDATMIDLICPCGKSFAVRPSWIAPTGNFA